MKFYVCWIFLFIIIICSLKGNAQFKGLSIHGDLVSINIPTGFDINRYHPGNYLGGFQYNLPTSQTFEVDAGFDLFYGNATGIINDSAKEIEAIIPSIFAGITFNFDNWGIFGKVGYSPWGTINRHDVDINWLKTMSGFDMIPLHIGIKYKLNHDLDITGSLGQYFGNSITLGTHTISFTSLNLGFSYNLWGSNSNSADLSNVYYKQMYDDLLTENKKLENQNTFLIKQVAEIIHKLNKPGTMVAESADSVLPPPQIKSISVDSINNVYNLHIGQPLSIKSFVNKRRVSEDGKLILSEYNSIASTIKGFPSGIWFNCLVPDSSFFLANNSDFPRIHFKNNPSSKKSLVINVDVDKTESNNGIRLIIK